MRLSESWMREWVSPDLDTQALAHQLTMAGLEVDLIEPAAPDFSGVLVAEVRDLRLNPNADTLNICSLDPGNGRVLQVVSGATNLRPGMKVALALVGAKLPGNVTIEAVKVRGYASQGMICSAAELGLSDDAAGILELPDDAPLGMDMYRYLSLKDTVIELGLTPNRGDCLSMLGLAREIGALNAIPVREPDRTPIRARIEDRLPVELMAAKACPRYACRIVRGVNPKAQTPMWLRERLRRGGIRSLSPIVDVTNYVMLEMGQPLHAFDLGAITGGIQVRMSKAGESIKLLNGKEINLDEGHLVIADALHSLALAGVMGGLDSSVTETTTDILLESAWFAPEAIAGKARALGLHTDSSHRFERGVDPGLQVRALERATGLLFDIVGGRPGPVLDHCIGSPWSRKAISLRKARIQQLLGISISGAEVVDILQRLGMEVQTSVDGWQVKPPSYRSDIQIEVDLIEEIARIHGYENIAGQVPRLPMSLKLPKEGAVDSDSLKDRLVSLGYQEVISYSFIDAKSAETFEPGHAAIVLANPISAELSVMRPSLWPGLVNAAKYNLARQQNRVKFFESGSRFNKQGNEILQEPVLSGVMCGILDEEQWATGRRLPDFYDLKADVEALLAFLGKGQGVRFESWVHPALHPGQAARIQHQGHTLGLLGMLHPQLARDLELDGHCFLFELRLAAFGLAQLPAFAPLSRFPSVRRDLAIVVDKELEFSEVKDCILKHGGEILRDITLFDVYTGDKVDFRQKSLAFGLILQDSSRTLTDGEVDAFMARILAGLGDDLNAKLRN